MAKRMTLMLIAVGLFFGAVFGWKAFVGAQIDKAMSSTAPPPVTVSTIAAGSETWTPKMRAIGSLRAAMGVDITAQEPGMLTDLPFESGAEVEEGAILARQFVDDDRARLAGLEADLRLAKLNLERSRDLVKKKLSSQFDLDVRQADFDRASAAVRGLRLTINKKTIRAPFSGRIGIRQVDVGQYIEPGDPIVRLEALDQMYVDFPLPQRKIAEVQRGQILNLRVDSFPGEVFTGSISAISPSLRPETRNVLIEGRIDNSAVRLLPGMFADIDILMPVQERVVTVPQAAITYSPYGNSVFRIVSQSNDADATSLVAENVFVTTGASRGDQIAITSGLAPGDSVVTAGQIKLRNGSPVMIDNSVPVSNEAFVEAENN